MRVVLRARELINDRRAADTLGERADCSVRECGVDGYLSTEEVAGIEVADGKRRVGERRMLSALPGARRAGNSASALRPDL